ncbi:MAG TPA: sigma-70 family RNA polymerase sigma factor [Bacteroidales bacterium]|nr:sigma-70 family RNA polymerase sigma factor [Bacteroidales bacterium]
MHFNKILNGLLHNDEVIIKSLYAKNQQILIKWIKKNNGNEEDVSDIIQDALLIILRKSKEENLQLTCTFSTYLISICKHLWFQELRRRKKIIPSEINQYENLANDNVDASDQARYNLYVQILQSLEADERQLLEFYNQKKPIEEIMHLLGFRNKQAVADKKKNCLKKLRKKLLSCEAYKEFRVEILDNY